MHKRHEVRRDNYKPTVRFKVKKTKGGKTMLSAKTSIGMSHFGDARQRFRSANTHPGKRNKYMKRWPRG